MKTTDGRPPTMREVATLAGVSIKTVSRVVNQEPGVSPELVERVRSAIKMLDYRHNITASNLRRADQRTSLIGLVLEDVANPFSAAVHRAIERVARAHNTLVLAVSSDEDAAREEEIVLTLASRRVDGLIVIPAGQDGSGAKPAWRFDRPVVFVDRPPAFQGADSVTVDNRAATSAAIRHLAAHGHRRIAFLGDRRTIWTAAERHLGYIEGLAAEGIRLDPRLVRQDIAGSAEAERTATEMLAYDEAPSAFFAGQNMITIGVTSALQRLGLQRQIALVGFDDIDLAHLLDPGISVIAQDLATVGRTAADLLFARLAGDERAAQHIVVPTRFIPRGSGEITCS